MMDMEVFAEAVSRMAEKCPFTGNVKATISVHAGTVHLKSVVPAEKSAGTGAESIKVFTPAFTKVVLKDLSYIRLNYGTITVSVDAENGKLKFYEIGESKKYSADLLDARIERWHMRDAA